MVWGIFITRMQTVMAMATPVCPNSLVNCPTAMFLIIRTSTTTTTWPILAQQRFVITLTTTEMVTLTTVWVIFISKMLTEMALEILACPHNHAPSPMAMFQTIRTSTTTTTRPILAQQRFVMTLTTTEMVTLTTVWVIFITRMLTVMATEIQACSLNRAHLLQVMLVIVKTLTTTAVQPILAQQRFVMA